MNTLLTTLLCLASISITLAGNNPPKNPADNPTLNLQDEEKDFMTTEAREIWEKKAEQIDWWLQFSHPRSLRRIPEARGWTHLQHNGLKIAVLIGMDHGEGESYIPVSAYVYNQSFKDWRRFMTLDTRNAGVISARIDEKQNTLEIAGGSGSPLKKIASYSLSAVSDDRHYLEIKSKYEPDSNPVPPAPAESQPVGKK